MMISLGQMGVPLIITLIKNILHTTYFPLVSHHWYEAFGLLWGLFKVSISLALFFWQDLYPTGLSTAPQHFQLAYITAPRQSKLITLRSIFHLINLPSLHAPLPRTSQAQGCPHSLADVQTSAQKWIYSFSISSEIISTLALYSHASVLNQAYKNKRPTINEECNRSFGAFLHLKTLSCSATTTQNTQQSEYVMFARCSIREYQVFWDSKSWDLTALLNI